MNIKNLYVKLDNEVYDDFSISNEELTILTLLYRNYMLYQNLGLCNIDLLVKMMKYNTSNNRKIITTVKNVLKSLIEKEYIKSVLDLDYNEINIDDIDKNTFFYISLIEPATEGYFQVFHDDLNKIFNEIKTSNINKFGLIRYYIACCRVTNNDFDFGYLSHSKMNKFITDSRSVKRYNTILEKLKIFKFNSDYITQEKKYTTTFISKFDNKDYYDLLDAEVKSRNLIKVDKTKSNVRRSIKQKINNALKDLDLNKLEVLEKEYQEKIKALEEELKNNKNESVEKVEDELTKTKSGYMADEYMDTDDFCNSGICEECGMLEDLNNNNICANCFSKIPQLSFDDDWGELNDFMEDNNTCLKCGDLSEDLIDGECEKCRAERK